MYGAQALDTSLCCLHMFENDVEMYGAQADLLYELQVIGLRMM